MAKLAFSKLGLKKQNQVTTIVVNDQEIEVKQYLPVDEKLDLISRVIMEAHDENNFPNPIKLEVIGTIEIILTYTNLTVTDKQRKDTPKLFDLLEENNITNQIIAAIPKEEYDFVITGINETVDAVYTYQNSILGILDTVAADYSNLELDASHIQKLLGDPKNLGLLREVLTKLG